jgi:hypothetical protein
VFEGVEELEQLVADPLAVAAPPDAGGLENAALLQPVQGASGGGGSDPVAGGGGVGAHHGLGGEAEDDLAGHGIGAR